jgi:hypothetical protein
MSWIKPWIKPAILVIAWITILSYTVSMVATVEPALRGQRSGYVHAPSPFRI